MSIDSFIGTTVNGLSKIDSKTIDQVGAWAPTLGITKENQEKTTQVIFGSAGIAWAYLASITSPHFFAYSLLSAYGMETTSVSTPQQDAARMKDTIFKHRYEWWRIVNTVLPPVGVGAGTMIGLYDVMDAVVGGMIWYSETFAMHLSKVEPGKLPGHYP